MTAAIIRKSCERHRLIAFLMYQAEHRSKASLVGYLILGYLQACIMKECGTEAGARLREVQPTKFC